MSVQKGSKITARTDSAVNVLDYPTGTGSVVATFAAGEHVGYAVSDEVFFNRTNENDPTLYLEVFYFSEDTFLPVAIGYVDQDSIEVGPPENADKIAPVQDENGNTLEESKREGGVVVKDPKTGKTTVVVPSESPAATQNTFPAWAKWTIIGIAVVLTIVSGVWIYGQYKKSQKGKKS